MSKSSGFRVLAAGMVAAALALALPAAAHADSWKDESGHGWGRGHHKHHKHHRHHGGGWDAYYAPPPVVVVPAPRPRVVYAPPPAYYYEPPPRVIYAPPPQRAGVNIGVYLPFR